ncbi:WxL domain-containing protein, partial [Latilactobacillus curvatus]
NGPTGATGDITIDNLTSLDFDKVKLTGGAQNVKNIVKDPNVQVTDKRGTGAGWNITVKSSEFKDTTDSTHILKGAQINFPVGKVVASDSTNTAAPTAKAITVPADGLDNAQ